MKLKWCYALIYAIRCSFGRDEIPLYFFILGVYFLFWEDLFLERYITIPWRKNLTKCNKVTNWKIRATDRVTQTFYATVHIWQVLSRSTCRNFILFYYLMLLDNLIARSSTIKCQQRGFLIVIYGRCPYIKSGYNGHIPSWSYVSSPARRILALFSPYYRSPFALLERTLLSA